jgi:hypothetical protein
MSGAQRAHSAAQTDRQFLCFSDRRLFLGLLFGIGCKGRGIPSSLRPREKDMAEQKKLGQQGEASDDRRSATLSNTGCED